MKKGAVTFFAALTLISSAAYAQSPYNSARAQYCRQEGQIAYDNCQRNAYDPFGVSGEFCSNTQQDIFMLCLTEPELYYERYGR